MRRGLGLVALAAWTTACASIGVTPPPPPRPPPSSPVQFNVSIYDEASAPVTDATATLDLDVDAAAGEPPLRLHGLNGPGWRQSFAGTAPPAHVDWDATLTVTSPNYVTYSARVHTTNAELPNVVMKATHAWGDESGWLRRDGKNIVQENGELWRYAGYTAFQLLKQSCAGVDVDPFIEDGAAVGARVFRVLGMFDPWIGTFTLARDDLPRYDACLLSLVHQLAAHGLRIQFVVFADAQNVMPSVAQQQQHVAHIAALIANEWNVLEELCNECEKNGVDPQNFTEPPGRVLWSRGSGLSARDPAHPAWKEADYHEARDDQYHRKNECRPYMDDPASPVFGFPCLQSEPMGASEVQKPGSRDGAVAGDPISIERAVNRFGWIGMNFGLQNNGGLCHTDAGIVGGIMGPVQRQMCAALFRGLNFPPTAAYTWPYQRGDNCGDCNGVGAMPLEQLDTNELRIFCRANGNAAWCVDIDFNRPPRPRAGWHLEEQIAPGLLRLAR